MIVARSDAGKDFGVILVPEGLIEFIPQVGALIKELNELLVEGDPTPNLTLTLTLSFIGGEEPPADMGSKLSPASGALFQILPEGIKNQMMMDRDPHGNVQVSRIETEGLLIMMCEEELAKRKEQGLYKGRFASQAHFFGYEGRACLPSDFDAKYCYGLGATACALLKNGLTGYMANLRNLKEEDQKWIAGGAPITMMMNVERRHGKDKPVIRKALTELDGGNLANPFKVFCEIRDYWQLHDCYTNPGPIQLAGGLKDALNYTLMYEQGVGTYKCHQKQPGPEIQGQSGRFLNHSAVQAARVGYQPPLPTVLQGQHTTVQRPTVAHGSHGLTSTEEAVLRGAFPTTYGQPSIEVVPGAWPTERKKLRVGVVFCGRQTPGGHNVVAGLLDAVQGYNPDSELIGFLGGTEAFFKQEKIDITTTSLRFFRSQGGIDMIGRSVDRICKEEHFVKAKATCEALQLDGVVLIGGPPQHPDPKLRPPP